MGDLIVRIMGEGQVRLSDSHLPELNKLAEVRGRGAPLPDDALEPSDLILPSPDATLEEVRELLSDDGLIPG